MKGTLNKLGKAEEWCYLPVVPYWGEVQSQSTLDGKFQTSQSYREKHLKKQTKKKKVIQWISQIETKEARKTGVTSLENNTKYAENSTSGKIILLKQGGNWGIPI